MFSVYKHTSPNGKVYIGITSKNPEKRWANGFGYKNNKHFWRAIQKYGWSNFEHEILYEGLTQEQANIVEQMQIAYYDSSNRRKGYNISIGGGAMTGRKHSEKTRAKMSERAKGRSVWNKGKVYSEELKKKLSEAHKGIKQTEETKRKRAEALKGHRVNIESISKPVVQLSKDGVFINQFSSISEAAKQINSSTSAVSHISECCRGKRKQCYGYKWKYMEGEKIWESH